MNKELAKIVRIKPVNKLSLNIKKKLAILFFIRAKHNINVTLNGEAIQRTQATKFLVVVIHGQIIVNI